MEKAVETPYKGSSSLVTTKTPSVTLFLTLEEQEGDFVGDMTSHRLWVPSNTRREQQATLDAVYHILQTPFLRWGWEFYPLTFSCSFCNKNLFS